MTHLHISVPAITRATLARTHELKRINFFENPKSIFKYPKLYLSILTDSSFVILETLQQKSNSSIKGKKNGQLLIILLYRRDRKIKAVPFFQVVIRFHRVLEKLVSKDVH